MPVSRIRLALVAASLLACSACDSGSDSASGPDALIGVWSLGSAQSEVYFTVNTPQLLPDLRLPTTGSLTFSGDVTGSLSYGDEFGPSADRLVLKAPNRQQGGVVNGDAQLYISPSSASLNAVRPDGTAASYQTATTDALTYDYRTGTATVRALTLTDGSGRSVSVAAGSVRFQGVALPVGVQTLGRSSPTPLGGVPAGSYLGDQIEFMSSHAFHATETHSDGASRTVGGTWSAADGQLRLTVSDAARDGTATFEYAIRDGALRLGERVTPGCAEAGQAQANAGCLVYAEGSYSLQRGTLTAIAGARVATFARARA